MMRGEKSKSRWESSGLRSAYEREDDIRKIMGGMSAIDFEELN